MTEINQKWKIGDCRDLMRELEPDSVDLIVTDPPYGYSFMGKDWDKAVPPVETWKECLRILKPGAFAFIMSAPRQDVLAYNFVNLSDAGFDIGFTSIYWTFASGFPKAGNIGKLVDKRLGGKREVIGKSNRHGGGINYVYGKGMGDANIPDITTPATSQAKALDGSYGGFQPKPAVEVIIIVMKPLSESTYVDQALTNGKGITWLDDGRIPYQSDNDRSGWSKTEADGSKGFNGTDTFKIRPISAEEIQERCINTGGRFPANLLVSDDVLNDGKERTTGTIDYVQSKGTSTDNIYGKYDGRHIMNDGNSGSFSRYFDIDAWMDEQIKQLPKEAQKTFPFLITPKASKSEKGNSCTHPTVKPVKLISWLITIGSQKDDLVLDPFLGSGTTLEAGRFTGRRVLGFEISDEWEHLYRARCISHQPPLSNYI